MTSTATVPASRPGLIRRTLRKRWLGILDVWFVGTVVLELVAYTYVQPFYEASSIIRVVPEFAPFAPKDVDAAARDEYNAFLSSIVKLINSPEVLNSAATDRKLALLHRKASVADITRELHKSLSVSVVPETILIKVSMTSNDPGEAAVLVNCVVLAFIKSNEEYMDLMERSQIRCLDSYWVDLNAQADELEARWKELVAKGVVDNQDVEKLKSKKLAIEGQALASFEQAKRLSEELYNIHIELIQVEAWAEAIRTAVKPAGPISDYERIEHVFAHRFNADPQVAALESRIVEAKKKLDEIRRNQTRSSYHPAEAAAQRKFDSVVDQFHGLWKRKHEGYLKQAVETSGANSDQELREAESRIRSLKARQAAVQAEADKIKTGLDPKTAALVEAALLLDKQENVRTMQEIVGRWLAQLKFEAKGETRITLLGLAVPPSQPISNKRPWLMLAIPFAMLFTAISLFTGIEAYFGARVPTVSVDTTE